MIYIRSTLFNIFFFVGTGIFCIYLLWTLPLPRRFQMRELDWYFAVIDWGERVLLNLKCELRGLENLPKEGSFIIAAKHQSMYETMKLPHVLNDPAIILKKELMKIPLWGWYAKKVGHIAIDRANRDQALTSIFTGTKEVIDAGRPIVIFPQGTRVAPGTYRQYKFGVARFYQETNLPVVPLALNSGVFWPKRSFLKRPGTVVLEFMPPIPPGESPTKLMRQIEEQIETASNRLSLEAGGPETPRPAKKEETAKTEKA